MSKGNGGSEGSRVSGAHLHVRAQRNGGSYFRGNKFQVEISKSMETANIDLWP